MKNVLLPLLFLLFGTVLKAQQWTPVTMNEIPADFDIEAISVVNADVVWVIADTALYVQRPPSNYIPLVLRTINGGVTWQVIRPVEVIGRFAKDIYAISADTAIITTAGSISSDTKTIFKTTNGGLTWNQITASGNSGIFLIQFFDAMNGVVVNNNRISTTNDAGNTWTQVAASNIPAFLSGETDIHYTADNFSARYGDRMWFGTNKGRVMRTLDRGLTWQIFPAAGSNDNVTSIAFTDANNGVLTAALNGNGSTLYAQSKLFTTNDGGNTWAAAPAAPMGEITQLTAVPGAPNHYFAGSVDEVNGSNPVIARNTNGFASQSWITTLDSAYISAIEFADSATGYAAVYSSRVGNQVIIRGETFISGAIWKWTGSVLTNTAELKQELDIKIFPNPSSDWVFIERTDGDTSPLFVTLSDLSGRVVFLNEILYNKLNINNLPKGIYFLKIQTKQGIALRKIVRS